MGIEKNAERREAHRRRNGAALMKLCGLSAAFSIMLLSMGTQVFASAQVVAKINGLYTLVIGIIQAAGGIVLAWGVFEFAAAYQAHDTSQQTQSLKKIVSGILMVLASTIVGLLK